MSKGTTEWVPLTFSLSNNIFEISRVMCPIFFEILRHKKGLSQKRSCFVRVPVSFPLSGSLGTTRRSGGIRECPLQSDHNKTTSLRLSPMTWSFCIISKIDKLSKKSATAFLLGRKFRKIIPQPCIRSSDSPPTRQNLR